MKTNIKYSLINFISILSRAWSDKSVAFGLNRKFTFLAEPLLVRKASNSKGMEQTVSSFDKNSVDFFRNYSVDHQVKSSLYGVLQTSTDHLNKSNETKVIVNSQMVDQFIASQGELKIEDIKIIASICKSNLTIKDKKGNKKNEVQYLASTVLKFGYLDLNLLLKNVLEVVQSIYPLKVVIISLTDFEEDTTIVKESIELEIDNQEVIREGTLIVQKVNFYNFLKKLDSYFKAKKVVIRSLRKKSPFLSEAAYENIVPSPIFIFEGISWSNIVYLFKIHDLIISGGTYSKRHKLNKCELKLAMFLAFSFINLNEKAFDISYMEDKWTLAKYEKILHDFNRTETIQELEHKNPIVYQFYKTNLIINGKLRKEEILKNIQELTNKVSMEQHSLSSLEDRITSLEKQISNFWDGRDTSLQNVSKKKFLVLNARFKALKVQQNKLNNDKLMLNSAMNSPDSYYQKLIKEKNRLEILNNVIASLENLDDFMKKYKLTSEKSNMPTLHREPINEVAR
jgi:hypothetical protein